MSNKLNYQIASLGKEECSQLDKTIVCESSPDLMKKITDQVLNPDKIHGIFKRVFIGHRGVGKSSLLCRHQEIFTSVEHYDLDAEISKKEQKSVSDIFLAHGETYFRQLEKLVFAELIQKDQVVISVGGGFDPSVISDDVEVVWVRRDTDVDGRIFLNRPALLKDTDPLIEYKALYKKRTPAFEARANWVYDVPEGIELSKAAQAIEKKLLIREWKNIDVVTLTPRNKNYFVGVPVVEVRDDLFTDSELPEIFNLYKCSKIIFSFRRPRAVLQSELESPQDKDLFLHSKSHLSQSFENQILNNTLAVIKKANHSNIIYDWALELGSPVQEVSLRENMISLHECASVQSGIDQLSQYEACFYKLCPLVEKWEDLLLGYKWEKEAPARRFFLPRSGYPDVKRCAVPVEKLHKDPNEKQIKSQNKEQYNKQCKGPHNGKWKWFRRFMQTQRKSLSNSLNLNFVRQTSEISDQPTLFENLLDQEKSSFNNFLAVLGSPVYHSQSPMLHADVVNCAFYSIDLEPKDFSQALEILDSWGLKAAAITSPLKKVAADWLGKTALEEANTLFKTDKGWDGVSTDHVGFKKLLQQVGDENLQNKIIAIWGGTGVLPALLKIIPQALCFSSRTGEIKSVSCSEAKESQSLDNKNLRAEKSVQVFDKGVSPQIVIWAAPRGSDTKWPEQCGHDWHPEYIIDLNYTDHSMGLEYAWRKSVPYISGIEMLKEQGLEQQKFWRK